MNAPTIWIIVPAVIAILLMLITSQRILSLVGGITAILLASIALIIPIEEVFELGALSFKIESSLNILGRTLSIQPAEGSLLALIYGTAALWFFGAEASKSAKKLVPIGLLITSLMIAAIAVEPFLFAALFIEMVVLLAVPMLTSIYKRPGKGIIRFLIYQTLAMPFLLLSGWLLAGVESSPGDLALAAQSASILGLGFAFLFAIFPLYSWIPMLLDEASPFVVGFLLWLIPTITIIFGAGFIDRYSWLRSSPQLTTTLQFAGIIMIVTGGLWAAFQTHIGRMMAYGSVAETGLSLLALSLDLRLGISILFLLLPARALAFAVWSLSLTILKEHSDTMRFSSVRGMLRISPLASAGLIIASLSTSGFPLLAGFPARLALWDALSRGSFGTALWMGIGIVGLFVASFRMLAVLSMADEYTGWEVGEDWLQGIMLGLGVIGLFFLGVFPQSVQYILSSLPGMFEHLGR
ncbi:MAG TPA: proton-conducting transporter membrane subunit [Anaerolineales bacterium]|nr:proton-conducting transporter membrane subunit [Anaerolineales bacterium]